MAPRTFEGKCKRKKIEWKSMFGSLKMLGKEYWKEKWKERKCKKRNIKFFFYLVI